MPASDRFDIDTSENVSRRDFSRQLTLQSAGISWRAPRVFQLHLQCLTPRMSREQTASPFASRATEGSELDSHVRHSELGLQRFSRKTVGGQCPGQCT